jgi:hypothetical protein
MNIIKASFSYLYSTCQYVENEKNDINQVLNFELRRLSVPSGGSRVLSMRSPFILLLKFLENEVKN